MSEKTGLKVVYFELKNRGYKNVLRNEFCSNPYEFISLLKNAEYVVTNSFHGTVFSIVFNKRFWTIPHTTRGSRMVDLLNKFELSGRIVHDLSEFMSKDYNGEIDYNVVNTLLEKEREKSMKWLLEALNS